MDSIEASSTQGRASASDSRAAGPRIWAVGGGKGGVGKSVITSSLGITLARRGERVIVVDLDLGGANLHTLFGCKPERTLTDFINGDVASLAELLQDTSFENLWLISSARQPMAAANPHHAHKQKILRHLRCLDVDHVFLDLGAGSTFNTLDFFLAARRGIMVAMPEPTSIENTYHFLKAAFFRSLSHAVRNSSRRDELRKLLVARQKGGVRHPSDLIDAVAEADPETADTLRVQARTFCPLLIVNQTRTVEHRRVGREIGLACRQFLGTRVDYLGALEADDYVRMAVNQRKPVLEAYPRSPFARDIDELVDRLLSEEILDPSATERTFEPTDHQRRALESPSSLASYGIAEARKEAAVEPEPAPQPEPEQAPAESLSFAMIDRAIRVARGRRSRISANVFMGPPDSSGDDGSAGSAA
jgi:flagellar biosynthesis protein FlhG